MTKRMTRWSLGGFFAAIGLSVGSTGVQTSFAQSGYSIRYVDAAPKRGTRLTVGDHIMLSVTVEYKLTATDKGSIVLALQKADNSPLVSGRKQVQTAVPRGSGEITLKDEFDVPAGTSLIRVFVPLIPTGYGRTSGEVVIEYPVKKR